MPVLADQRRARASSPGVSQLTSSRPKRRRRVAEAQQAGEQVLLRVGAGSGRRRRRSRVIVAAEHVLHDVEVVGGEVDRHAGVLDARRQRPDAGGVGAEDAAEAALGDQLAQLRDRRVEALDVADHQLAAGLARGAAHPQRVRQAWSRSASRPARAGRRRAPRARPRRACSDGQAIETASSRRRRSIRSRQSAYSSRSGGRPMRARAARLGRGRRRRRAARTRAAPSVLDVEGAHPAAADDADPQLAQAWASSTARSSWCDGQLGDPLGGVAVAEDRRALGRARLARARRANASGSTPTSVFQPVATVSTHSVSSRSVMHGHAPQVGLALDAAGVGGDRRARRARARASRCR